MKQNRQFPSLTPYASLILATTFSVALVLAASTYLRSIPSLGLKLAANEQGVVVIDTVYADSPLGAQWQGQSLRAIGDDSQRIQLRAELLLDEPNKLDSTEDYRRFLQQQQALYQILNNGPLTIELGDKQFTVQANSNRPLGQLPWQFWIINLFAVAVFLIAVLAYRLRPQPIETRILLTAASGILLGGVTTAIYSSRELALPADVFATLKALNVLGIMLFSFSLVALFAYYPKRISRLPMATTIYTLMVGLWLVETLVPVGLSSGFYKYFVNYLLTLGLALYQWHLTRNDPLDRAALQWLVISIATSLGLAIALYYLPILLQGNSIINLASTFGIIFIMFVGFSLGIARYRLFHIERWWFEIWLWVSGATLLVLIDGLLIAVLETASTLTVSLSLLIMGWLYFPIRQWWLAKILKRNQYRLENYLPLLIQTLFAEEHQQQPREQYTLLLQRIFDPLHIEYLDTPVQQATIAENGMSMQLPGLHGAGGIRLNARNHGSRLFSPYDLRLQESLGLLAEKALSTREAYNQGAYEERQRIKRDLHDEVAVKLIELIHSSDSNNAAKARKALDALRHSFQVLESNYRYRLHSAVPEMIAEFRQQLLPPGVQLRANIDKNIPELTVSPRHMVNIRRIIEENIRNILQHAQGDIIRINIMLQDKQLKITIQNNGHIVEPSNWSARKGLHTIKTRAMEIGGKIQWHIRNDICHFEITIPLNNEGALT